MNSYLYIWLTVAIILLLIVFWFIAKSNQMSRYLVIIEESKKNVDIALAKRYDTILEMLKVAKSYAQHEEKLFVNIVKLRRGASVAEMNDAMVSQDNALRNIFAVGENYPQMLSSQQFLNLQSEIAKENDQLAASKRIVNSNISLLNQMVVTFPISIVAAIRGVKQMDFLREDDVASKKDISGFDYSV